MQIFENQLCAAQLPFVPNILLLFLLESGIRQDLLCRCEDANDLRIWMGDFTIFFSPSPLPNTGLSSMSSGKETFYRLSLYPISRKGCNF